MSSSAGSCSWCCAGAAAPGSAGCNEPAASSTGSCWHCGASATPVSMRSETSASSVGAHIAASAAPACLGPGSSTQADASTCLEPQAAVSESGPQRSASADAVVPALTAQLSLWLVTSGPRVCRLSPSSRWQSQSVGKDAEHRGRRRAAKSCAKLYHLRRPLQSRSAVSSSCHTHSTAWARCDVTPAAQVRRPTQQGRCCCGHRQNPTRWGLA